MTGISLKLMPDMMVRPDLIKTTGIVFSRLFLQDGDFLKNRFGLNGKM
jgi:hypothetical protein